MERAASISVLKREEKRLKNESRSILIKPNYLRNIISCINAVFDNN